MALTLMCAPGMLANKNSLLNTCLQVRDVFEQSSHLKKDPLLPHLVCGGIVMLFNADPITERSETINRVHNS